MRSFTLFFAILSAATFGCAQTISGGDGSFLLLMRPLVSRLSICLTSLLAMFHSGGIGSCGRSYSDTDLVVFVDHATMAQFAGTETDPTR